MTFPNRCQSPGSSGLRHGGALQPAGMGMRGTARGDLTAGAAAKPTSCPLARAATDESIQRRRHMRHAVLPVVRPPAAPR